MTRTLCLTLGCILLGLPTLFAQTNQSTAEQSQTPQATQKQTQSSDENPPEEDEEVAPRKYYFDPLEAERNIKVGNFYMHQGNSRGYRAALGRYEDATRYNPTSAEAFFKVGEAQEKLKNSDRAKTAFERVLKLAPPDSKLAKEAKKKLAKKG